MEKKYHSASHKIIKYSIKDAFCMFYACVYMLGYNITCIFSKTVSWFLLHPETELMNYSSIASYSLIISSNIY